MSKVYRFTGPPENWTTGISLGKWAVNENNRGLWEKLEPGDIALLHSTAKSSYSSKVASAVIGYAVIAAKKWVKDELWWIQEKQTGENTWPYVFSLDEVYLFSPNLVIDFNTDIIEKTEGQIKREIEALAKTGLTIASLNELASKSVHADIPKFPVNGSASRVNAVYEQLVLARVENYYLYQGSANEKIQARLAEEIDDDLQHINKNNLITSAKNFTPPADGGYATKEGIYVVRKDNERQKRIVAKLEDYTCQVCGFACEYIRSSGKPGWIIEIDHIVDKANGGTEVLGNLWALCPNCHKKKTRGVIQIDINLQQVFENGTPVTIRDNHLGWR